MRESGDIRNTRVAVRRRELIGLLLWVGAVAVVYGTLALPFHVHLLLVFLWLVFSGIAFVAMARRNIRSTERVFREALSTVSEAHDETIIRMATYSEARDALTGEHLHRVRAIAHSIALRMGCTPEEAEGIGKAAVAHDLGKIGVPDAILGKPGRLTDEEFERIKTHTTIGEKVLGTSAYFELERMCARHHHERWDGSGYPDGLRGEQIPLVARITSVADVFDALATERPYKRAWDVADAVAYIEEHSGSQFDPDVVTAFLALWRDGAIDGDRGDRHGDASAPLTAAVF